MIDYFLSLHTVFLQLLERGGPVSLPPLPSFSDSTSSAGDEEDNQSITTEPRPASKEDLQNIKVTFSIILVASEKCNFYSA